MNKIRLYIFVLSILVISGFFVNQAYAANCGGAVVCACGDTVTASTTLTTNLVCTGHGLVVGANNITIDGNSHTITGDGGSSDYGINNSVGYDNINIKNFSNITNFNRGIYFSNSSTSTIQDNNISSVGHYGIYLYLSNSNLITNNTSTSNGYTGIYLGSSDNNTISNNVTNQSDRYGINLYSSASNTLSGNTMSQNGLANLYISGATDSKYNNTITTTNLIENKPVYYFYGQSDQTYDGNIIGNIGMFWCISCNNITVQNAVLSYRNYYGVYFRNTNNSTIRNINSGFNGFFGIHLSSSTSNLITDNTLQKNGSYGLYINSSPSNTITNNILTQNVNDIYDNGSSTTYSSNQISNNINLTSKMLVFSEVDRTHSVNDYILSTTTMYDANGNPCSTCSYTITTTPTESVTINKYSNVLSIGFSPQKIGTYSLIIYILDPNGNSTKRNFLFFVGDVTSRNQLFYLRDTNPNHVQQSGIDGKTMLLTAPTSTEVWTCYSWIQNSIDEIPNYPLGHILSIDSYTWYKTSVPGYIGVQRFASYDAIVDATSSVSTSSVFLWTNKLFNGLNWSVDFADAWYWLSLKLAGSAGNPSWQTTAAQPSYADFTYQYTITPGIKSISNDNVAVLSATAPVSSTSTPSIVLENRLSVSTSTTITLSNLATSTYYQVTVDGSISSVVSGSACNDNRLCLTDSDGILSLTYLANDSSLHTLGLINYPTSFNLISPEDNYRVYSESSMPPLTWQASLENGSQITKYQLYIDDTLYADNINSASTSIEISKPSEGLHRWYIKSVDNNGNVTQSPSFSIIITTASSNNTFSSNTPVSSPTSTSTQSISTTTQEITTLSNTIRTLQIQLISLLQQLLGILLQTQRQIQLSQ